VNGVVVVEVIPASPAAQGGLRACDLIDSVAGKAVQNPSQLQLAVDQGRVGQPLQLQVRRGDRRILLSVRPAELPRQG
jgi:S1-C subfamily serine protease